MGAVQGGCGCCESESQRTPHRAGAPTGEALEIGSKTRAEAWTSTPTPPPFNIDERILTALPVLLSADTVLNTGNGSNGPHFIDEEAEAQTRGVQPAQGLATGVIHACFHGPGPGQGKAGQTRRYKD